MAMMVKSQLNLRDSKWHTTVPKKVEVHPGMVQVHKILPTQIKVVVHPRTWDYLKDHRVLLVAVQEMYLNNSVLKVLPVATQEAKIQISDLWVPQVVIQEVNQAEDHLQTTIYSEIH
jgi:hypothetical protein